MMVLIIYDQVPSKLIPNCVHRAHVNFSCCSL